MGRKYRSRLSTKQIGRLAHPCVHRHLPMAAISPEKTLVFYRKRALTQAWRSVESLQGVPKTFARRFCKWSRFRVGFCPISPFQNQVIFKRFIGSIKQCHESLFPPPHCVIPQNQRKCLSVSKTHCSVMAPSVGAHLFRKMEN